MPLQIVRNDITTMQVDVIVNAANTELKRGGGVCGAIFSAAGADRLQAECDRIGGCKTGEAVITSGYDLPARYIIHTPGPVWQGGSSGEARLLHNSYTNSLQLALENQCESIAFSLISSGIYGYPKDQALQIAIGAISEFLLEHEMMVYLVVFDKKAFSLSENLFTVIEKYIDDNYVEEHMADDRRPRLQFPEDNNVVSEIGEDAELLFVRSTSEDYDVTGLKASLRFKRSKAEDSAASSLKADLESKRSLEDVLSHLEESFSQMLLRLIDKKGLTDVETYQRANIDRKLFSKIRSKKDYQPKKVTAVAFAIALKLNIDETRDLLGKAGYVLSRSSKFDVIIEYFIQAGNYNIHAINEALFYYDQVLLGA